MKKAATKTHAARKIAAMRRNGATNMMIPQMMTFVASASGFALLTGIVTYVIELITSLNERIHLSLSLSPP